MKLFDHSERAEEAIGEEEVPEGIQAGYRKVTSRIGEAGVSKKSKLALIVCLLFVGILSFTVIGDIASSPESHEQTIAALDESRNNVALMTVGALGVSTAANMIPGDAGKSVSDVLSQITAGLAVVLAVILLEKYLLTAFGFAAFKVLIPIACLLLIAAVIFGNRAFLRKQLVNLASKLVAFGLVLFLAIPVSVGVSGIISQSYDSQLKSTLEMSDQITEAAEESIEEEVASDLGEAKGEKEAEQTKNFLEGLGEALSGIPDSVSHLPENIHQVPKSIANAAKDSATAALSKLESFVNLYIEGFAVMIVTSCLIPLVVVVVFFWLANVLLGLNVSLPTKLSSSPLRSRKEAGE